MKKLVTFALVLFVSLSGFSQSLFDKYEDSEDVGSVIINKGMIDIVSKISENQDDEESQAFAELANSIKNIKVFVSDNDKVTSDMASTVKKYVKSSKLVELMKVKDGDTNVKFFVRNGKDDSHAEELLMFVTGIDEEKMGKDGKHFETVLLTMTGDIDLTKVGTLTKKMNLPKELNKAGKKGE